MSIQSKYLLPSKSIFLMPLWLVASFHTQKHCPSLKKIGIQVMCKSLVSTKRIYRNLQKRSKKVQGPWKTHSNSKTFQPKWCPKKTIFSDQFTPPPQDVCVFPKKKISSMDTSSWHHSSWHWLRMVHQRCGMCHLMVHRSHHGTMTHRWSDSLWRRKTSLKWRCGDSGWNLLSLFFFGLKRWIDVLNPKKKTIQTGGNF